MQGEVVDVIVSGIENSMVPVLNVEVTPFIY